MKEVILTLITQTNGAFMVMFVVLAAALPVAIIVAAVKRDKKLVHNEKMNALKFSHDEIMFKLSRELPEVIGSERAIEHKSVARREE